MLAPNVSSDPFRILLVEDEAAHAALIRLAFEKHPGRVTLHVAGTLQEARAALATTTPSLVIADLRLPDGDGVELLPAPGAPLAYPVVIMTSHGDEQVAVEAMKAGALDYVVKSEVTLAEMPRLAERALREWGHITEFRQAEEALRRSEERLRTQFQGIPVPTYVWQHTADGFVLIDHNAAAETVTGGTIKTLKGRLAHDLYHDRPRILEDFERCLQEQTPIKGEMAYRLRTTGEIREVAVYYAYVPPDRVMVHTEDITERKRMEREILEISNREQRRIGQDLHDELGQLLTGICFRVAELETDLHQKNQPETADAAEIGAMIEEAIVQTRALAQGLNPVSLETGGLKTALATLAHRIEQIYEIPCTLTCPTPFFLDDTETTTHVYRIAQEALNNAIKHGKASRLAVSLVQTGTTITLTVRDNGVGLPNTNHEGEGMGLRNMRYRAGIIRGAFDVHRGKDGGTVVRCQFTTKCAGLK